MPKYSQLLLFVAAFCHLWAEAYVVGKFPSRCKLPGLCDIGTWALFESGFAAQNIKFALRLTGGLNISQKWECRASQSPSGLPEMKSSGKGSSGKERDCFHVSYSQAEEGWPHWMSGMRPMGQIFFILGRDLRLWASRSSWPLLGAKELWSYAAEASRNKI